MNDLLISDNIPIIRQVHSQKNRRPIAGDAKDLIFFTRQCFAKNKKLLF